MVVVCSDPPHKELEEEEDIVTACHDDAESVSVRKITTMFKVLYLVHIIQIYPGQVTLGSPSFFINYVYLKLKLKVMTVLMAPLFKAIAN